MKRIIYTLLALSVFISCEKFLDKVPNSEITEDMLGIDPNQKDSIKYKTAEQAENLLQAAYKTFDSEFWQLDWYIMNDAQADNAYAGEPKEQTLQFDEFRLDADNASVLRDWKYCYAQVAAANSVIQWVPLIQDAKLSDARKKEIVAEASFIRAIANFNLVRLYGDVPLVTQEAPSINSENIKEVLPLLYPERVAKDTVYKLILSDLNYAKQYAPDYSDFKFRVTKALVNFILAEVYATKDGFEKTDWEKVRSYAAAVESNPKYALMPVYDDLFAVEANQAEVDKGMLPSADLKYENCIESLFEVNYTSWTASGNWGASMFYGIDWKKFNTPSQDLLKAFEAQGDEVRKKASIKFGDVTGKWADKYWPSNKYPYCYKLRSQEKGNIILYRYAEAVLLLAEAENELGNIGKAKTLLNKIRSRVGLKETNATTKEEVRLAIENEHRLEFAFEGKRWMDLKRRGRFIQVMNACSDHQKDFARTSLAQHKLIWPVPQTERDQNTKLTQNPGY